MGYVAKARAEGMELDPSGWRTLQILDEHGWMVLQVQGADDIPDFAYAVGAALHRPDIIPWELFIVGPELQEAKQILKSVISRAIRRGLRLAVGPIDADLEGGAAMYVAEIPPARVTRDWFGYGLWFARKFGDGHPRYAQVVWPDIRTGAYPWHERSRPRGMPGWADQPLLGEEPTVI